MLFLIIFAFSPSMGVSAQEPGGICCDPDAGGSFAGFINCITSEGGIYNADGCIEDTGCPNYTVGCVIPITDGIPLLIIAGGVFAFYRLREKKELLVIEA